ncbi:hypothetical protein GOP47_0026518 [Adiantum capillus-veneris]|nr:hypothetical protein GOP47_0026518 [Adiantum capillus-veneris]
MSCASPISQLSPASLRMYMNASNLLSPSCRSKVDEPNFSFDFLPSSSSSPPSSSSPSGSPAAKPRPVLTDILLQRHKNSPQSPFHRSTTLLSPRKGSKENREIAGSSQNSNADIVVEASPGKAKKSSNQSLLSPLSPRRHQPARNSSYVQLDSPRTWGGGENRVTSTKSPKQYVETGVPIDASCISRSPCQPINTATANCIWIQSPQACSRVDCDADEKSQKHDVEIGAPIDAFCSSPSPLPLKRKRPTKLSIPEFARLASFGKAKQFELPPHEPLSSEILSFEAPFFGVSCRKGRRDCMEDTHTALTNFQGKASQAFFGVFDGHGGKSAAQFAAETLARHIATAIENQSDDKEGLKSAMQAGYLAMDSEFLEKGLDSGACSISAFVKDGHLVVANAGDCKAVLCRGGKAEALSNFHRPSNAEERQRIQNLGGFVDCFNGVWRVQGTLAVTRGFGDAHLKKWISAEPEVRQLDITNCCEFLILASDGLWDKVNDQEAVDCVREVLGGGQEQAPDSPILRPCKVHRKNGDASITIIDSRETKKSESTGTLKVDACNKLIHKAHDRGNLDDITVMVVPLATFM